MAALRTILRGRKLYKILDDEIRKIVGFTNTLVKQVYVRQHKWLGHVFRMDHEGLAKTVLKGKVEGTRSR